MVMVAMSLAAKINASGQWPKALATLHAALASAEERDYAAAITTCVKSLQWTWALQLLTDALSTGLKLGEPTWNKMVSAAGRKTSWQSALAIFELYPQNRAAEFGNSTHVFFLWATSGSCVSFKQLQRVVVRPSKFPWECGFIAHRGHRNQNCSRSPSNRVCQNVST